MTEYDEDGRGNLRRMLGEEVKSQRERRGWTQKDLEAKTRYNHAYFSRVESGDQLPSEALATGLDVLFENGGVISRMLEAIKRGSIHDYSRGAAKKERKATRIQVFNSSLVPGLLQSEDYMRALFTSSTPGISEEEVNASVVGRMNRQKVFEREDPPLYWAIMDEAALKRPIGGRECMARQCENLVRATQSPNVTVQVYPFDQGGYPMLGGSLTLLAMPDGEHLAHVENFKSGELVESPKRVAELTQLFDWVRMYALCPVESLKLIEKYMEDYTI
ncbi:helix-turn-helix domain-containing protein [Streptomyces sp. 4N509B]|uniref:helix-turn-helix domain-containing protein n=1 Tax=Streptomyces sp. 4N509B TaxID=3457413 RepID=UPI003FD24B29